MPDPQFPETDPTQTDMFCEHCGDLPPGTKVFSDGGTTWCTDCAVAIGILPE